MAGLGAKLKNIFGKKRGHLAEGWNFRVDSEIIGGIAISDVDADGQREIIFGTKSGELFCLSNTGKPKWKFNVHETMSEQEMLFFDPENMNSIESAPHVSDLNGDGKDEIIFGSELGTVYCLNAFGQLIWKFKAEDAVRGGVTSADLTGDTTKEVNFGKN